MDYIVLSTTWPNELILGPAVTHSKLSRQLDVDGFYRWRWLRIDMREETWVFHPTGHLCFPPFLVDAVGSRKVCVYPCPTLLHASKFGSSILGGQAMVSFPHFFVWNFMAAIWILWILMAFFQCFNAQGYIFTVDSWWSKLLLERRWSLPRNLALESWFKAEDHHSVADFFSRFFGWNIVKISEK